MKSKTQKQKVNPITMVSQELLVPSIVQSNLYNFGTSKGFGDNISMPINAELIYDSIFNILELEKNRDYTVGELIIKFRNLGATIKYVGKIKMPPGDIDFSIKEEFTSGFRQRFLENVLFETQEEKNNFESILEIIDSKIRLSPHLSINHSDDFGTVTSISLYGWYHKTLNAENIFTIELSY